jgi:transposase
MFNPSAIAVRDDSPMNKPGPRAGGPVSRRVFSPAEKLEYLGAYDEAVRLRAGGAYLREHGIYSSQVTEWRRLRDAGVLAGPKRGSRIGKLTPEQAEIARLRRELDITQRRLGITEVALGIMGKAHELLEEISKSSNADDTPSTKR